MKTVLGVIEKLSNLNIYIFVEDGKLKTRADESALTSDVISLIKENKKELLEYLSLSPLLGLVLPKPIRSSIRRDSIASFSQQRLWLLDQIDSGSAHYNMPRALKLAGILNIDALNRALTSIIERHESLRTTFAVNKEDQLVQVIKAPPAYLVTLSDLSGMGADERELQLSQIVADEASRTFDLRADLMLRAHLIKVAVDEHILLVTMHHIASDGWSMSILTKEFGALYSAYAHGHANPLIPLSIQYADYAYWQRNWLQGELLEQQLSYWTKQLEGLPVVHSLPLDKVRPTKQSFVGRTHSSLINVSTTNKLKTLSQAQGATLFMGLHAAFSVLLSRYSNEMDIVIGSPIANREQSEVADLIGFFVNTLVLRSDLSKNPSFIELLNQSKNMLLDAYAHQQVPFEQIVERLQPERSLAHSALFQVMLVLQNNEVGTLELPGLTLTPVEHGGAGIAKYDLTLNVSETAHGLCLSWEYNTDLFDAATIARMAEHFALLLKALVNTPDANVFAVDMLSLEERHKLLVEWNNTTANYPKDKCIHELFELQVVSNPTAKAVIFEEQQLSYSELNQKANQLAHYLINEKMVKPDTLVGICVERSLDLVIGILAILKAGGAYVPLDPELPEARLKYLLDDAKLGTVLTQVHLCEATPVTYEQAVCLDDVRVQRVLQTQSIHNPSKSVIGLMSSHLAYVIYTSGSTGNPKGVMVEHENVVNFLAAMRQKPGIEVDDCLLAVTSTSFDIHGLELFLPLVVGAKLVIASKKMATSDPGSLLTLMANYQISLMQATPATWKMLLDSNWVQEYPLKVLCGGEALSLHMAQALLTHPTITLWNMYGPTETTIWSTVQQVLLKDDRVLMGQPISNTQIYIARDTLALTPIGVAGELLIGGLGLARGYLGRPDLTEEKFISNPFYNKNNYSSSERLYRTGDFARWLPNGALEFIGRIDHQVKIRGFRIELGEIEHALLACAEISSAVVLAKSDPLNESKLIAYVTTRDIFGYQLTDLSDVELTEMLREKLKLVLPNYMVPNHIFILDKIPLTPNGKVDRNALLNKKYENVESLCLPPRNEAERKMAYIWADVLNIDASEIGVTNNFFKIGGDSLSALKLINKINEVFFLGVTLSLIFEHQILEELVCYIERKRWH